MLRLEPPGLRRYLSSWCDRLRSVGAWAKEEFALGGVEGPLSAYSCLLAPEIAPYASLMSADRVAPDMPPGRRISVGR